jgi:predicted transposase/invertase (TIGR01784 family)
MLTDEWNWEEAKEVWYEEGIEKGREQVERTARNLLAMGMAIDDIAQATELPVEKVYALASEGD